MNKMRILIIGANGFIGQHLMRALCNEGHQVVGCVRNPAASRERFPRHDFVAADFTTDHSEQVWRSRVSGFDVVINGVGIIRQQGSQTFESLHIKTPIALFQACQHVGVKKVIQISALGADESAISQYHQSKKKADDYLSTLNLDWIILRPSIVYGNGAKSMAFFKALAALPCVPLIGAGDQLIQPIHISDLVGVITTIIQEHPTQQRTVDVVGPEPIAIKSLLTKLRFWLGFGLPCFISIPFPIAWRLGKLSGLFGDVPFDRETITMLQQGNTGDVQQVVEVTGIMPKRVDQILSTHPSQTPDQWHACLYFLAPVLRLAIAFVWLFTGYISAFVYPHGESFALLAQVGISAELAPYFLYGASALDVALGIAVLCAYRTTLMGWLQVAFILLYTLIISYFIPEQWLHPFGPISKNLPMIMSIVILTILEEKR
jgi:nucleoside-diphosphate-sugar epimerase/uncharacterized membrane protein YphA (DoxX/SURF4 family)